MAHEFFRVEHRDGVALVKISRPSALNALNLKVLDEFEEVFDELKERGDLCAVVLTGEGDKAFIAGADIAEMSTMSKEEALAFARKGQSVTLKIENLPVPVIAAVNGYALGGGCEIAIACDFILASAKAVFGQPEVCLGLLTGFGGAVRLADFVGWPMARELIFTGRRIDAQEAHHIGLANKVIEPDKLLDQAMALAKSISANSPLGVRKVKAAMVKIRSEAALSSKLEIEARSFSSIFGSFDQREGTRAFLEKRKAQFKGE